MIVWKQKRCGTSVRSFSRRNRAEISAMRRKTKDCVFLKISGFVTFRSYGPPETPKASTREPKVPPRDPKSPPKESKGSPKCRQGTPTDPKGPKTPGSTKDYQKSTFGPLVTFERWDCNIPLRKHHLRSENCTKHTRKHRSRIIIFRTFREHCNTKLVPVLYSIIIMTRSLHYNFCSKVKFFK